MNCRYARQLISPYLDQQLTGRQMLEMQEHFARCPCCAEEMHSILQVKCLLRGLHVPAPSQSLSDTIGLRLQEAERGADGWRVLSLPPRLASPSLISSLLVSSFHHTSPARPPRGRRLATALGLSCLTVLSIAAPFAPASHDGARMTSGFLPSSYLLPSAAMPPLATLPGSDVTGPETLPSSETLPGSDVTGSEILSQMPTQVTPTGDISLIMISDSTVALRSDLSVWTRAEPPYRKRFSVFSTSIPNTPSLPSRLNAVSPADYSR